MTELSTLSTMTSSSWRAAGVLAKVGVEGSNPFARSNVFNSLAKSTR